VGRRTVESARRRTCRLAAAGPPQVRRRPAQGRDALARGAGGRAVHKFLERPAREARTRRRPRAPHALDPRLPLLPV